MGSSNKPNFRGLPFYTPMSYDEALIFVITKFRNNPYHTRKVFPGNEIPVSAPFLDDDDIQSLFDVLLSFWYTEHVKCNQFEAALSEVTKKSMVNLVNSGSSANLAAITAMANSFRTKGKKYVITCASTFPTAVSPIYQVGSIPIYIDIDPMTLSPDMEQLQEVLEKYSDQVYGVVLTHNLGFLYDEAFVRNLCSEYKIGFVADCCDALGSVFSEDVPAGYYADLSTYSFFPAHHITTIEGGAVATNSLGLGKEIRKITNWGRDCFCNAGQTNACGKRFSMKFPSLPDGWDHKYTFTRLGYNLKMTEFQAALGITQLKKLEWFKEKRIANYNVLSVLLDGCPYIGCIKLKDNNISPFGFPIRVFKNDHFSTRDLIQYLESKKIRTRPLFAGNIIRQPAFKDLEYLSSDILLGSDIVMEDMFWVGCHPKLSEDVMEYVGNLIVRFVLSKVENVEY